jgi:hypothetical protein
LIQELLTYLKSKRSASKEAQVFGHLYESIALIEREKRCRTHWLSHRTQCKTFISEHLHLAVKKRSVLVLGSGPLHEIPLEVLADTFDQVDLVDIVHPEETKKFYAQYTNVKFIEADITELEKDLIKEKKPIEKIPTAFIASGYDLVISANLMSQLAYHLRTFLQKKVRPKMTEAELDQFCNLVTQNHYFYLKNFNCPVILITDIETILLDKSDKIIQKETPYIDFTFPTPLKEWWWNVAPIPEYSKNESLKMKVAGFLLNV